jgi:hypothetical protein
MSTKEPLKKKQFEEKSIDNGEYEYVTIPPDGGFGWIVALAAMVFGIFYYINLIFILFNNLAL